MAWRNITDLFSKFGEALGSAPQNVLKASGDVLNSVNPFNYNLSQKQSMNFPVSNRTMEQISQVPSGLPPTDNLQIGSPQFGYNLSNRDIAQLDIMSPEQRSQELQSKKISGAVTGMLGTINPEMKINSPSVFKGFTDLTTNILNRLVGKSVTSKQEILNFTNMPELKQAERDLIRRVVGDFDNEADGITIYHGSPFADVIKQEGFSLKNLGKSSGYEGVYGSGVTFTTDPNRAKLYGKVVEAKIPSNLNLFETKDPVTDLFANPKIKNVSPQGLTKTLKEMGYDGVKVGDEIVIFDPKIPKIYSDKINVQDFANRVKAELLPLKIGYPDYGNEFQLNKHEYITLPKELRGSVANYNEHVYQSPIKTSAGDTHFGGVEGVDSYFGHTRIEDMADNKTRRVIEVQSDLYQKGNLDRELPKAGRTFEEMQQTYKDTGNEMYNITKSEWEKDFDVSSKLGKEKAKKIENVKKLQQYNNPTAHFRMIREEVKQAAKDGKTKLQFPTGETIMKIEGLGVGSEHNWVEVYGGSRGTATEKIKIEDLKVGKTLRQWSEGFQNSDWIITDVLGDGKFKAVQKSNSSSYEIINGKVQERYTNRENIDLYKPIEETYKETFDISGKVDTNNPIYKFYEKEIGRYLKNKYNAQLVTDKQGVSWWEVNVPKEFKKLPVEAFGVIGAASAPLFVDSLFTNKRSE